VTVQQRIEIGLMAFMGMGLLLIFVNRWQLKRGMVGVRVSQFLAVLIVPALAAILALEGKISSDALTGLLGAVVGYVLSPLAKESEDSN